MNEVKELLERANIRGEVEISDHDSSDGSRLHFLASCHAARVPPLTAAPDLAFTSGER